MTFARLPIFRLRGVILSCAGAVCLVMHGSVIAQTSAPANPQIDYAGFLAKATALEPVRRDRLLSWEEFAGKARSDGALLLDARSPAAFAQGHIKGAVNLPISDFTDAALAAVIGANRDRPIYIYCNNNFTDNRAPIVTKRFEMALNIQTFINLHGYGYANVWELGAMVSTSQLGEDWVESGG